MTISTTAAYLPVMRVLGLAAVVLLLAGAASAAASGPNGPVSLGGMVESNGSADLGSAPGNGELIRFIPNGRFAEGVLLQNRSGGRLVIEAANVIEPRHALISQIGTQFHRWNPPKCPAGASCPAYAFPLHTHAAHPHPFSIARGKDVGVELDFRLGSCAEISSATSAAISQLRVSFHKPGGPERSRVLTLGGAELHLRMPERQDCVNPHSSLNIDGPNRYSTSYYWTVPGSGGDVCTIANGRFNFVSRLYKYEKSYAERVELHLSHWHFVGARTYHRGVLTVVADGKQVFRSRTPVVTLTKATRKEVIARIEAGHAPKAAVIHQMPFHVTGTLRCRVRP